jgi:uncharacterized repeat protein (TIGR03803 family)
VLYGTASAGGTTTCGCGIVFSIVPGNYQILHVFDPHIPGPPNNSWPNGATPLGGLLINNGTIYGTTNSGGQGALGPNMTNGAGIVYSMSTTGGGFAVLHNFDGDLNTGPQGMIIFGQDGAIYGTQFGGGLYNQGVIWRMTTGGAYSVLYNFLGTTSRAVRRTAPIRKAGLRSAPTERSTARPRTEAILPATVRPGRSSRSVRTGSTRNSTDSTATVRDHSRTAA